MPVLDKEHSLILLLRTGHTKVLILRLNLNTFLV
jgi:hypothetical protein